MARWGARPAPRPWLAGGLPMRSWGRHPQGGGDPGPAGVIVTPGGHPGSPLSASHSTARPNEPTLFRPRLQLLRCNHAGNLRGSARPDRPTRPVNVPQVRCNHSVIRCPPTDCGRDSLISVQGNPFYRATDHHTRDVKKLSGAPICRFFHSIHEDLTECAARHRTALDRSGTH